MRFRWFVLAGCAGLLSACSGQGEQASDPTQAESPDLTPEGPSLTSRLLGGGKPMPLDVQQAHPNGVVLQLTSIQVKPSETVVTATISNGDDKEQSFNKHNNKNTYIVAGDGSKLYLSPPANNAKLEVPAGQRMQAELVFLGRLENSGPATLIINDGSQSDSEYTTQPGFRIPLTLTDAAFSDDGSKKN